MQKHVLDAWMVSKIYVVIFRRRKVLEASGTRRSDEGRVVGQHFKLHQWAERFPVLGVILVAMEVYWSLTRDASKGSRFTRSFSSGWEERPSFFDCPPTEMPPSKLLNSWYLLLGKKTTTLCCSHMGYKYNTIKGHSRSFLNKVPSNLDTCHQ